jgi:hypothetical protein
MGGKSHTATELVSVDGWVKVGIPPGQNTLLLLGPVCEGDAVVFRAGVSRIVDFCNLPTRQTLGNKNEFQAGQERKKQPCMWNSVRG